VGCLADRSRRDHRRANHLHAVGVCLQRGGTDVRSLARAWLNRWELDSEALSRTVQVSCVETWGQGLSMRRQTDPGWKGLEGW
jgi:hypothetical protein